MEQGVKRFFAFMIGAVAWASLVVLVWGILLGWFPQAHWTQQLIAGVIFFLIGLVTTLPEAPKKEGK